MGLTDQIRLGGSIFPGEFPGCHFQGNFPGNARNFPGNGLPAKCPKFPGKWISREVDRPGNFGHFPGNFPGSGLPAKWIPREQNGPNRPNPAGRVHISREIPRHFPGNAASHPGFPGKFHGGFPGRPSKLPGGFRGGFPGCHFPGNSTGHFPGNAQNFPGNVRNFAGNPFPGEFRAFRGEPISREPIRREILGISR